MKRGRPSSFDPKYPEQAKRLASLGATDREIAEFFGVSEQTLNTWKHAHPEFLDALKTGKGPADQRVEASLYRRATGYTYDAVKIFQFKGREVVVPYQEHVPPDTTACIFWLKNRKPKEWRDKIELGGSLQVNLVDRLKEGRERAERGPTQS